MEATALAPKFARDGFGPANVLAPKMLCSIVDDAIQAHGGGGVTTDFGLGKTYASARVLRLVDGPDEVHNRTIARLEFKKYKEELESVLKEAI